MSWWRKWRQNWKAKQLLEKGKQLYWETRFADAMPLLEEAARLARERENWQVAAEASELQGDIYRSTGRSEEAKAYFTEGLTCRERLGDFAGAAALRSKLGPPPVMGRYELDESLRQPPKIQLGSIGGSQQIVQLNQQTIRLYEQGQYDQAVSVATQVLDLTRSNVGKGHPNIATSLNNLAMLYKAKGDYAAAEPLYQQALEIRQRALPEGHPNIATSLNNLAALYTALTHSAAALSLMQRAAAIRDHLTGQIFAIASDSQRTAYLKTFEGELDAFLSLVFSYRSSDLVAVRAALDLVLRRKAIGAEALAAQRDAVLSGRYPHLEPQVRQLMTLREQIIRKRLSSPGPEGLEAYTALLAEWEARKDHLEADLARHIPEMNLEQRLRNADRVALAQAMPPGVVLVEVVRFAVFDFTAVPVRGERRWQPARYLAFVVPAREPDNVRMVDLGEAEEIDTLVAAFRESLIRSGTSRVGARQQAAQVQHQADGHDLRAAVFDPLKNALGGNTSLFLSPDGDLTRLPFEVLPLDDGQLLMDTYRISYLSTGRDVLRLEARSSGPTQRAGGRG